MFVVEPVSCAADLSVKSVHTRVSSVSAVIGGVGLCYRQTCSEVRLNNSLHTSWAVHFQQLPQRWWHECKAEVNDDAVLVRTHTGGRVHTVVHNATRVWRVVQQPIVSSAGGWRSSPAGFAGSSSHNAGKSQERVQHLHSSIRQLPRGGAATITDLYEWVVRFQAMPGMPTQVLA